MGRPSGDAPRRPIGVRCAIYTRKSTEEGLDQEFNSLDAQREACAAYVLSQRHEGWTLLPDFYDDGGYSGGNMDRPGIRRLLADVKAGKVDVIVVYKVDRLTRALSDFARIVETLDEAGASFVSITQSFNTTTSMGRLTLNVLLSFAQFEREVISERVRDKVAASKRKGIWMGGTVPLGYDAIDRKLLINEAEARTVRHIFERYLELRSVRPLLEALAEEGVRTKVQAMRDGSRRGGIPFTRGPLYHLLKNPIYIGLLPHKKVTYPGQHSAIISEDLWHEVQKLLRQNGADRKLGTNAAEPSLLTGMLKDEFGRPMTASHAAKGAKRYRYYVSVPSTGAGPDEPKHLRLPAGEIEKLIKQGIVDLLACEATVACHVNSAGANSELIRQSVSGWAAMATRVPHLPPSRLRALLLELDLKVTIGRDAIAATIVPCRLQRTAILSPDGGASKFRAAVPLEGNLVRRGQELRVIFSSSRVDELKPNQRLLALLVKGHAAVRELKEGEEDGPRPQTRKAHLCRLARAAYLAPDIVEAIIEGRQPSLLTARQLLRVGELSLDWSVQRQKLGFPRRPSATSA